MVCTLLAGVNVVAFAADGDASDSVSVLRAYNPNNGEHLMTIDVPEYEANVARGYQGEGTAWKAPVTSGTPIYRIYNPNSGEHMLTANAAECPAGWQAEGQKMYSDDEMGVPIYRVFNPNATDAGSHHYCGKEEATGLVARGWNWDNNGEPVLYGVDDGQIVKFAELLDKDGLQTDGTALEGDTLQVTYTPQLGNPTQVTWYRNGSAVKSSTSGSALGLDFTYKTSSNQAGTWFAVITNSKGETYQSNSLTVSANPAKATISDYTLTQDYASGVDEDHGATKVDYTKTTDKLVATFTVNKSYTGLVGLVESDKVLAGNAKASDVTRSAIILGDVYNGNGMLVYPSTFTETTNLMNFTDEKAIAASTVANNKKVGTDNVVFGLKHTNDDGSVTYKWVVNSTIGPDGKTVTTAATANTKLVRGTNYVLGMAQDNVSTPSDINTYVVGGMQDAPYVIAPSSIAITQCAKGQKVKVTLYDEEGAALAWMGTDSEVGLDTVEVYGNQSNGTTGATRVSSTPKVVKKGVYTSDYTIDGTYSYYYAKMTFAEGVFGEDKVTLTSDIQKVATQSAEGMDLYEDTTVASTAVVKFRNLATDGTVFIVNSDTSANALDALLKKKTSGAHKIVGQADAKRGDAVVKVEGALKSTEDKDTDNDNYFAFFVPSDVTEYSMVGSLDTQGMNNAGAKIPEESPDTNSFKALKMIQVPCLFSLNVDIKDKGNSGSDTFANTGGAIVVGGNGNQNLVKVMDQFGKEYAHDANGKYAATLTAALTAAGNSWTLKQTDSTTTAVKNVIVEIKVGGSGYTELTVKGTKIDGTTLVVPDASTSWTGKNAAQQTITVKTVAQATNSNKVWTVTIQ